MLLPVRPKLALSTAPLLITIVTAAPTRQSGALYPLSLFSIWGGLGKVLITKTTPQAQDTVLEVNSLTETRTWQVTENVKPFALGRFDSRGFEVRVPVDSATACWHAERMG